MAPLTRYMRAIGMARIAAALALAAVVLAYAPRDDGAITSSGSALGAEADLLRMQIARYVAEHPSRRVVVRVTPDAADQRHQLYVRWLNARATAPDILQLDVIWTAEFAAAGWILPLDAFHPPFDSFFKAGRVMLAATTRAITCSSTDVAGASLSTTRRGRHADYVRETCGTSAGRGHGQVRGVP